MQQAFANANVCVCVCVCVNQSLSTLPLAGNRGSRSGAGGRRNTGRGDVFLLCCRLFWLRPWLLSSVFILWRVHVEMALGDVIASMPLVKQGLFFTCRGCVLVSLATGVRQCMHVCVCVCVCVPINRRMRCPGTQSWQSLAQRCGGRGKTGRGNVFCAVGRCSIAPGLPSHAAHAWFPWSLRACRR